MVDKVCSEALPTNGRISRVRQACDDNVSRRTEDTHISVGQWFKVRGMLWLNPREMQELKLNTVVWSTTETILDVKKHIKSKEKEVGATSKNQILQKIFKANSTSKYRAGSKFIGSYIVQTVREIIKKVTHYHSVSYDRNSSYVKSASSVIYMADDGKLCPAW